MYSLELLDSITTNWKPILNHIIKDNSEEFEKLCEFLNQLEHENTTIYPPKENIFACFNKFNRSDLKVVLIGQDPYHGPNQAMGLSFSIPSSSKVLPPSLRNIFKELNEDIGSMRKNRNGDLSDWAEQGVLLLNTSLSVTRGKANSHSAYWKWLSDEIIKYISNNCDQVVFMLWGNHARSLKKIIDSEKHYILEATHPSPLGANRGGWFGSNHFSKSNNILSKIGKEPINWTG